MLLCVEDSECTELGPRWTGLIGVFIRDGLKSRRSGNVTSFGEDGTVWVPCFRPWEKPWICKDAQGYVVQEGQAPLTVDHMTLLAFFSFFFLAL